MFVGLNSSFVQTVENENAEFPPADAASAVSRPHSSSLSSSWKKRPTFERQLWRRAADWGVFHHHHSLWLKWWPSEGSATLSIVLPKKPACVNLWSIRSGEPALIWWQQHPPGTSGHRWQPLWRFKDDHDSCLETLWSCLPVSDNCEWRSATPQQYCWKSRE